MEARKAVDSFVTMNELVLPNDTNTFGDLMGGKLMYWMDIAAYLSASKHCNSACMTASVDNLSFKSPIKLGNVICIEAIVTRAFNTSMEVHLKVWNQNMVEQTRVLSNEAYFTFVALDENKRPKAVPEIIAESENEKKYYDGALRRRQLRLILAGKMKPNDATELKALFTN
jgi:acyl-CoA hydrolase